MYFLQKEIKDISNYEYPFKDIRLEKISNGVKRYIDLALLDPSSLHLSKSKLSMDLFQLVCVDNNLLKVKIYNRQNNIFSKIEAGNLFNEEPMFKQVLKEKDLFYSERYDLTYPVEIENYKKKIPSNIIAKKRNIEKTFEALPFVFYVSDLIRNPDPVLIIQIKEDPSKTFVVGAWDEVA